MASSGEFTHTCTQMCTTHTKGKRDKVEAIKKTSLVDFGLHMHGYTPTCAHTFINTHNKKILSEWW